MSAKIKICTKCGEEKSVNCFHKQKTCKDGLKSKCKICVSEYFRCYRVANTERIYKLHRIWTKANRDKCNKGMQRWRHEDMDRTRRYARGNDRKYRLIVTNGYIKKGLIAGTGLKFSDLPSEVVELKKIQIQIKRELKKQAV